MSEIETLPAGWKIGKPFRYCHIIRGSSPFQRDDLKETGDFVAVQYGKSYKVDVIDENFNFFVASSFHKENQEVKQGDTVFITTSETVEDLGHICYYNRPDIGLLGGEQMVLRPFEHIWDSKFFYYCATCFHHDMNRYATGLKVYRVKAEDLKRIDVYIPPKDKQIELSAYLDKKTTAIDTLITSYEKLLSLLAEKRQAIISEAVTKGLDPHAEMKDSGVEWIGEIPVGWKLVKLKLLTNKIGSGKTPKGGSDVYTKEGIIFLRSQNVYNSGLLLDDVAFITEEIDQELANTRLVENDILLNITGGSIGRCCVWNKTERGNVNQHVCIIRANGRYLPKMIHFLFMSALGERFIEQAQTGANREGLNFEDIGNFPVPFPPLETQQQIVQYLDEKTSKIDQITADTKEQIALLKEYRQSLISEVVTGKVEV